MLIRPPQLQFFKDGIKITATDTNYYQREILLSPVGLFVYVALHFAGSNFLSFSPGGRAGLRSAKKRFPRKNSPQKFSTPLSKLYKTTSSFTCNVM